MNTPDERTAPSPGNTSPRARAVRLINQAASLVTAADVHQWLSFDSAVVQKAWEIVDPTIAHAPALTSREKRCDPVSCTPQPETVTAVERIAKYSDPRDQNFILVVAEISNVEASACESFHNITAFTRHGRSSFVTEPDTMPDTIARRARALLGTRVLLFVEVQNGNVKARRKRIIRRIKSLGEGIPSPSHRAPTPQRRHLLTAPTQRNMS